MLVRGIEVAPGSIMPFSSMPPVTRALLLINVGAYLLINLIAPLVGGEETFGALIHTFGLKPSAFWQGAFWQPLTSMFLHASLFHIFANMLGVWSIGSMLERGVGSNRYLWLYMISGLAGALLVLGSDPSATRPTIGASGAVLGLLGAIAVLSPNSMLLFLIFPVRARTAAILIGVGSLLMEYSGSLGTISHLGHLGGLIGGYLYTRFALSAGDAQERMYQAGRGSSPGGQGFGSIFRGRGPGPARGPFAGGGATGQSPGNEPRGAREEMMLRMMEQMLRGQQSGGASATGQTPREKVINPLPQDDSPGGPSRTAPGSSSTESGSGPSGQGAGKRVIYFDPITGRFQVKEG